MNWFTLEALKQILMVVGGIVTALGWKDSETVQSLIGLIMTVVGAVWTFVQSHKLNGEVKSLRSEMKALKGLK